MKLGLVRLVYYCALVQLLVLVNEGACFPLLVLRVSLSLCGKWIEERVVKRIAMIQEEGSRKNKKGARRPFVSTVAF